jgi:hypothetical protein
MAGQRPREEASKATGVGDNITRKIKDVKTLLNVDWMAGAGTFLNLKGLSSARPMDCGGGDGRQSHARCAPPLDPYLCIVRQSLARPQQVGIDIVTIGKMRQIQMPRL